MPKFQDLKDMRFGMLVVTRRARVRKPTTWVCRCDCGKITQVTAGNLKCRNTTSCGCFKKSRGGAYFTDYAGVVFKGVTVLRFDKVKNGTSWWIVRCNVCSREGSKPTHNFKSLQSCGCRQGYRTGTWSGKTSAEYAHWKRNRSTAHKLHHVISGGIRVALKRLSLGGFERVKVKSWWDALPYTVQELIAHLENQFEPWMGWHNYGKGSRQIRRWQIDHIIPTNRLRYKSVRCANFKKLWALSNLRPLDANENASKRDKLVMLN